MSLIREAKEKAEKTKYEKYLADQKTAKALQEAEKIVQEQNRKQVLKNILNIETVATTQEKVVNVKKEAVKIVEEEITKTKAEKKAELIKDIKFALIKANIKQQEEFKNINKFKLFVDYLGENSYKTLQNLYEPLKKAGDKNADSVWAYLKTQDQGLASTVFQLAGNTAGGTAGFVGTATGGAITEIIKAVGWDDELTELSNKFLGTGAGQALIKAISMGEEGVNWFEKNYPEAARNAKALLGAAEFATMFVGVSTAKNLAKKAVVSLKFNLKLIKANIQKIKLKAANVKAVIDREVQWYIDEFQNLNYAFEGVTPNGQRFALKIKGKDLENYDFEANIQKSVGGGSGVIKTATHLTKDGWDDLRLKELKNFKTEKAVPVEYKSGTVLYRGTNEAGKKGSWWTTEKPKSINQWRQNQAVKPEFTPFKDSELKFYTYKVPKGKVLRGWEGIAKEQPPFGGGGQQVWFKLGTLNPQEYFLLK